MVQVMGYFEKTDFFLDLKSYFFDGALLFFVKNFSNGDGEGT